MQKTKDTFKSQDTLLINNKNYTYFNLNKVSLELNFNLNLLPFAIKIMLENLIRNEDDICITSEDIQLITKKYSNINTKNTKDKEDEEREILFYPTRVLMQDFTGVPAIVDLATMRDAMRDIGKDIKSINPLINVDLVIDHSVQVDKYSDPKAFSTNVKYEFERNSERYKFLNWGQKAFDNFRVVPPGTGICHQVNLEYLAKVIWEKDGILYPDTLVGTDSHTTMINGLSVLGWGVGGIEAEAAMLGQPISMLLPKVVGFKLSGRLKNGITATDLVLTITQILRAKGVVGKFVEFFGPGLFYLSLADRATVANMAPEYGATCGIFPIDKETIKYLTLTGREQYAINIVEEYAKAQKMWYECDNNETNVEPLYDEIITLDLSTVEISLAGPRRPQDRVNLGDMKENFFENLLTLNQNPNNINKEYDIESQKNDNDKASDDNKTLKYKLSNGSVVISAITSCTNTSNPAVMLGAGLIAQKAVALGLKSKPWVKTSLAPGSQVVTEYLRAASVLHDLELMGFYLVGYGCTTCIGNSGPLLPEIEKTIEENNLVVASILSGNRNFEGRIHPLVRANYLASPMLCVIYAIVGTVNIDIDNDPISYDKNNNPVFMKDIWPSDAEIKQLMDNILKKKMFEEKYAQVFNGGDIWHKLLSNDEINMNYNWDENSTYIKKPNYFDNIIKIKNCKKNNISKEDIFEKNTSKEDTSKEDISRLYNINNARILAIFGDSITTDHISPAGSISDKSPAAKYLTKCNIQKTDFNSYGARRGNHEIMMRGTFANTRIKNLMLKDIEGGYTRYYNYDENENSSSNNSDNTNNSDNPNNLDTSLIYKEEYVSIYDAAMMYKKRNVNMVIFAGKEYGTGSSRDWAAKGPFLLGIKAVIAQSFERIHRSNLVGMGILPLVSPTPINALKLHGDEIINIYGIDENNIIPKQIVKCDIYRNKEKLHTLDLILRIDTILEIDYMKHGGILHFALQSLINKK